MVNSSSIPLQRSNVKPQSKIAKCSQYMNMIGRTNSIPMPVVQKINKIDSRASNAPSAIKTANPFNITSPYHQVASDSSTEHEINRLEKCIPQQESKTVTASILNHTSSHSINTKNVYVKTTNDRSMPVFQKSGTSAIARTISQPMTENESTNKPIASNLPMKSQASEKCLRPYDMAGSIPINYSHINKKCQQFNESPHKNRLIVNDSHEETIDQKSSIPSLSSKMRLQQNQTSLDTVKNIQNQKTRTILPPKLNMANGLASTVSSIAPNLPNPRLDTAAPSMQYKKAHANSKTAMETFLAVKNPTKMASNHTKSPILQALPRLQGGSRTKAEISNSSHPPTYFHSSNPPYTGSTSSCSKAASNENVFQSSTSIPQPPRQARSSHVTHHPPSNFQMKNQVCHHSTGNLHTNETRKLNQISNSIDSEILNVLKPPGNPSHSINSLSEVSTVCSPTAVQPYGQKRLSPRTASKLSHVQQSSLSNSNLDPPNVCGLVNREESKFHDCRRTNELLQSYQEELKKQVNEAYNCKILYIRLIDHLSTLLKLFGRDHDKQAKIIISQNNMKEIQVFSQLLRAQLQISLLEHNFQDDESMCNHVNDID